MGRIHTQIFTNKNYLLYSTYLATVYYKSHHPYVQVHSRLHTDLSLHHSTITNLHWQRVPLPSTSHPPPSTFSGVYCLTASARMGENTGLVVCTVLAACHTLPCSYSIRADQVRNEEQ